MSEVIKVEYPNLLLDDPKLNKDELVSKLKAASMIKLFELGELSSGIAAKVLNISRLDFLDLLVKYKVSILGNYDEKDLDQDILNA